jgi:hypothetical protein
MNKFFISCLLTAFLWAVPVAVFVKPDVGNLEKEGRRAAAFPEIPSKVRARTVKDFFRSLDAFFADRFPLRASLLSLSIALNESVGVSPDSNVCYRGKENWLFLGNYHNRCVDKLQGKVLLTGGELKHKIETYQKMRDAAEKRGAEFFIFVGPNKSTIYPEYLPRVVIPAPRRYIAPLLDSAPEAGIKIYDPTDRLVGAKSSGLLYYRTDTHWNLRGAYEAFEGFREYAGLPDLPALSFVEAPPENGDLVRMSGYKTFPLSAGDNFTLRWNVPPPWHEEEGLIMNVQATGGKTAWVFGDSFAEALKPYLAATFKEVRFFKHGNFQEAVASQASKPDVILLIMFERSF